MLLVFFVALIISIILIICIFVFMISISRIEINIKNMHMNNLNKGKNNEHICIKLSLRIGNWNWLKIKLNKQNLANLYAKLKIQEYTDGINFETIKNKFEISAKHILKNKEFRKLIKNIKIEVEKFNANIALGTEDYIVTSYIVATISIIISNILPHIISEKNKKDRKLSKIIHYRIVPIYRDENEYNIHLTLVACIKVWNLIKVLLRLIKINLKSKQEIKHNLIKEDKMNVKPV